MVLSLKNNILLISHSRNEDLIKDEASLNTTLGNLKDNHQIIPLVLRTKYYTAQVNFYCYSFNNQSISSSRSSIASSRSRILSNDEPVTVEETEENISKRGDDFKIIDWSSIQENLNLSLVDALILFLPCTEIASSNNQFKEENGGCSSVHDIHTDKNITEKDVQFLNRSWTRLKHILKQQSLSEDDQYQYHEQEGEQDEEEEEELLTDSCPISIRICIDNNDYHLNSSNSDIHNDDDDRRQILLEWCIEHGFEYLDMNETGEEEEENDSLESSAIFQDKFGLDRLKEALESHVWDGKTKPLSYSFSNNSDHNNNSSLLSFMNDMSFDGNKSNDEGQHHHNHHTNHSGNINIMVETIQNQLSEELYLDDTPTSLLLNNTGNRNEEILEMIQNPANIRYNNNDLLHIHGNFKYNVHDDSTHLSMLDYDFIEKDTITTSFNDANINNSNVNDDDFDEEEILFSAISKIKSLREMNGDLPDSLRRELAANIVLSLMNDDDDE